MGGCGRLILYDRALIVVTADHGEAFGEHGSWFRHGATLHEESTRVPLLIKLPAGSLAAGLRSGR